MIRFAILLILFTPFVHAKGAGGVGLEVGLGSGAASIDNPNNSKARYKILGVTARGIIPIVDNDQFGLALTGGLRFLDMTNTANNADQSEVGNMIGPMAGVRIRAAKFFVGYSYNLMLARHYAVGTNSRAIKYNIPLSTLEAGITIPFNQLSVSFSYNMSSGKVPKSGSGLTADAPYQDQTYWLQLTYSTGADFLKFLGFLF